MNKKKILAAGSVAAVSFLIAMPTFAATTQERPGVAGTVSAISGSDITIRNRKGASYTIDASNASVTKGFGKNSTAITLSTVSVGDLIAVQGAVDGTAVTATKIADIGLPHFSASVKGNLQAFMKNATFGTVSAVNGTSFTLTKKTALGTSTMTVTTDSSTMFKENGKSDALTDLAVGQRVVVTGTKDSAGTTIAATKVNIMTRTGARKTKTAS